MYVENHTQIANFPTPVYLTPPVKGIGIWIRQLFVCSNVFAGQRENL